MRKLLTLVFLIALVVVEIKAQNLNIKWSEGEKCKDEYDDEKYSGIVGSNSKYSYTVFTNRTQYDQEDIQPEIKKLRIIAFDNSTGKKVFEERIMGFRESRKEVKKEFEDLRYDRVLIYEDFVYIFYTKELKYTEEVLVETYDIQLKKIKGLQSLLVMPNKIIGNFHVHSKTHIIVKDQTPEGRFAIIGEHPIMKENKDEPLKIVYKVINKDLSLYSTNELQIPIKKDRFSYKMSSAYILGNDGNIYFKTNLSKDEPEKLKEGEYSWYWIFYAIQTQKGKLTQYPLLFEGMNIPFISFAVDNNIVKVFGLYDEISTIKNKKYNLKGLYYLAIDPVDMSKIETKFIEFDRKTLDGLFSKSESDPKNKIKFKKDAMIKCSENMYNLENISINSEGHLFLFSSKLYNYYWRYKNGEVSYDEFNSAKVNLTVFHFDDKLNLIKYTSLPRKYDYGELFVNDIRTIKINKDYFIDYANYKEDQLEKDIREGKMPNQYSYAIFDSNKDLMTQKIVKIGLPEDDEFYRFHKYQMAIYQNKLVFPYHNSKKRFFYQGIINITQ